MVDHEKHFQSKIVGRYREIKELKSKLASFDAQVSHLLDVNENIELETIIKIHVELLEQFKKGKKVDCGPKKKMS